MINGSYNIYLNKQLVAQSKNIITTSGKEIIKQYLAGNIPTWSGSIAVGAIDTTATLSDEYLKFEILRQATLTRSVDPSGNITLRASFPTELACTIKEVGVFPFTATTANGRYQDAIVFDFSEAGWSAGSSDSTTSAVGASNIKLDSSTSSRSISNLNLDISGYSPTDEFQLLVNNLDVNAKTIKITLTTDSGNTELTFPNLSASAGLQSVSVALGTIITDTVTQIAMSSTGSNKSVSLDCLRIINKDESGYAMKIVSRSVLATPITKSSGQDLEIEYSLAGL